jgi:hypothetical protein
MREKAATLPKYSFFLSHMNAFLVYQLFEVVLMDVPDFSFIQSF